ncbi:MAG: 50S ribosomal protein L22 [Actinobacteria bacterium]|nr:MAG: 50S ribosomal protein L22 [Actinomycetota bacterium]
MAAIEQEQQQTARAQAKYVRSSARKARLVTDLIRGRTVPEARTILAFTSRAAATEIDKVLRSAVANAEANHGLDGDELVVESAYADEGPTLKRWRARARGRVNRVRKRTCHVTLVLAEVPEPVRPARRTRRREAQQSEAGAPEQKPSAAKPKASTRRKKKEAVA